MNSTTKAALSKVPEVTLIFWIIKIFATTLGETGGDAVSMSLNLGYAVASFIFLAIFVVGVIAQIKAKAFHPFLYWIVIIATTTLGTTMADFADRSLLPLLVSHHLMSAATMAHIADESGMCYTVGSSVLLVLLMASLAVWHWSEGTINVNTVATPRIEMFYWVTILFSQTLGTALGDWVADTNGVGFADGALVFVGALALVAAGYFFTKISRVFLFWSAFILTRPLGATVGDLLDKPHNQGGFALSRFWATAILGGLMVAGILLFEQKAGRHPGAAAPSELEPADKNA